MGWQTSTFSNGSGGNNCVEVQLTDGGASVRDSKDRDGPVLTFSRSEWQAFLDGAHRGEFDLPGGRRG